MDSNDSGKDLELIAALIDGRLSPDERARAMKLLAESDEALELFASAARQQSDAPAVDATVTPISTARSRRRWIVALPIAAAAMLAIVLVPTFAKRGTQPDGARTYVTQLAQNPGFRDGLQADWDQRWAATRGAEAAAETGSVTPGSPRETRLAFRLGVRSIDLQVALSRGDTLAAAQVANEVVETLKGIALSDLVVSSYADLRTRLSAEGRSESADRAVRAEQELRGLLGKRLSAPYAFGQWAGAAELAAAARDTAFFASSAGLALTRSTPPGLAEEDVQALRTVDARAKTGLTTQSLDEIRDLLQSMIRRRGG